MQDIVTVAPVFAKMQVETLDMRCYVHVETLLDEFPVRYGPMSTAQAEALMSELTKKFTEIFSQIIAHVRLSPPEFL